MSEKKSKDEIDELLQKEIVKAEALSLILNSIDSHVVYCDTTRFYGQLRIRGRKCQVVLAKFMRKRPKKEISAVLMHEICHAQTNAKGHDEIWRSGVRKARKIFSYNGFEDCHLCDHPYSKNRPAPKKHKKKDIKNKT